MVQFSAAPVAASSKLAGSAGASRGYKVPAPGNNPSLFHLHSDAPILKETFLSAGMVPTSGNDFVISWSGPNIRDHVYQSMNEWQRINHFPGSTELTRKDRLWHHFAEMAQSFGTRDFDFVPETYVLPDQVDEFLECYEKAKCTWIVKPNASSRGRGIFMLRDLSELPLEETVVVSRYVDNPLLIQGLKFDLRVYVLVTAFEPLKAYIYREGLTRFASKPYSTKAEHMQDAFRHLTNYSINKNSCKFVENSDLRADNVGHKWSLSALNKHLHCVGVDVNLMWARVNDLIVKTLLSVEPAISARTRQMTPNRENCFELYGFDVLVDEDLKPWLLEVNLSPSMQAESPLDWQIKSSLVADAFNIVGVCSSERSRPEFGAAKRSSGYGQQPPASKQPKKPDVAPDTTATQSSGPPLILNSLSDAQLKNLAKSLGERIRCYNFVPLYPTRETVPRYECITEARAAARAPPVLRSLGGLMGSTGSRRLSPSQMLSTLFYGPRPVQSASMIRSQSMPMLRQGSKQPADSSSPAHSPDSSPKAALGDDDGDAQAEEAGDGQGIDLNGLPQNPLAQAATSGSAEGSPAALSATTPAPEPLPASVRDPDVHPQDREAALLAASRAMRMLGGGGAGRRRRNRSRMGTLKARSKGNADEKGESGLEDQDEAATFGDRDEEDSSKEGTELDEEDRDGDDDAGKGSAGSNTGCRLLLMEYLVRLEAACESLSAHGRARLAQSASYGRLSSFQKNLPVAAAKLALDGDLGVESVPPEASPADRGGLIDDLAASCRTGLDILERLTWREGGGQSEAELDQENSSDAELPEDSESPCLDRVGSIAQHRLPRAVLRKRPCQKLLKALPDLGASELEVLLRGPLCAEGTSTASSLKPLLETFARVEVAQQQLAASAAPGDESPSPGGRSWSKDPQMLPGVAGLERQRRGIAGGEQVGPGSLRPTGPLSELLRAALVASRRQPAPARSRISRRPGRPQSGNLLRRQRDAAGIQGAGSRLGATAGAGMTSAAAAAVAQRGQGEPGVMRPPADRAEVIKEAKAALANGIMVPFPRRERRNTMARSAYTGKRVSLLPQSKSSPALPELISAEVREATFMPVQMKPGAALNPSRPGSSSAATRVRQPLGGLRQPDRPISGAGMSRGGVFDSRHGSPAPLQKGESTSLAPAPVPLHAAHFKIDIEL